MITEKQYKFIQSLTEFFRKSDVLRDIVIFKKDALEIKADDFKYDYETFMKFVKHQANRELFTKENASEIIEKLKRLQENRNYIHLLHALKQLSEVLIQTRKKEECEYQLIQKS